MHKYETHMHSFPVSRCAKAGVEESLEFYKELGYDGVFVTNHFLDGNINWDKTLPYEDGIYFYFSDYEKALEAGKKIGIKVFLGVEITYKGTDFLIYGLDKQWFLDHPEIMEMKRSDQLQFMMDCGALVIQAHPYREASYIDHIRLFPCHVHGVEACNASRPEEENVMNKAYAEHYDLIPIAGSDNHVGRNCKRLAGISCEEPINSEREFMQRIWDRNFEIFFNPNPLYIPPEGRNEA